MKIKVLSTAADIIKHAPITSAYAKDNICPHIPFIERLLFCKCWLGEEFYNTLINDLYDTSGAENYDAEKVYNENDLICYNDCFYVSTCNNNTVNPDDDNNGCWIEPPKFKNECYCELWNLYLCRILAFYLIFKTVRYSTTPITAKGVVTVETETEKTVSQSGLKEMKKELYEDYNDLLELMFKWMVNKSCDENSKCDFSFINKVGDACSKEKCVEPKKTRRRRILFKK